MSEQGTDHHELSQPGGRGESQDVNPWHVPVAVEEISETAGRHFELAADARIRAGVARLAGLRDLPRLVASFDVTRHGAGGLRVLGHVSATAGQTCVVTLEPLESEIDEAVDLIFLPQPAVPGATGESDRDEAPREMKGDEPEPLVGGRIDLGAVAFEFLILGINPYPRKPGAVFEPPSHVAPEEGPFAALAGLKKGGDGR